jgi:adenylate kinase family enzyme
MQKRLKVFVDVSVPVVKYYESMGKVHKVSFLPTLFVPFITFT